MSEAMTELSSTARRFVREWGELGERWGLDRQTAEVQAMLYLAGEPLDAQSIGDALEMDEHEVRTCVARLREIGIVLPGSRSPDGRERWLCVPDVWEMFRRILEDRRRREVDPALSVLRECVLRAESEGDEVVHERLAEMQECLRLVLGLYSQLASVPSAEARKLVRMGSKIRKSLGLSS